MKASERFTERSDAAMKRYAGCELPVFPNPPSLFATGASQKRK